VKSSQPDPDLQVTVSEVRPDGKEVFVQSGWLRATGRKLDKKKSTKLEPVLSLRKKDDHPMPKGKYTELTVPLYYQGHVYRAGSQIRVTISAVDGDQPIWAFAEATGNGANISIAHSPDMPSQLLLPQVNGVDVPTGLPPCPGLRAEPCRDYVPYANDSGSLKK
jgi:predicted acyl esterase